MLTDMDAVSVRLQRCQLKELHIIAKLHGLSTRGSKPELISGINRYILRGGNHRQLVELSIAELPARKKRAVGPKKQPVVKPKSAVPNSVAEDHPLQYVLSEEMLRGNDSPVMLQMRGLHNTDSASHFRYSVHPYTANPDADEVLVETIQKWIYRRCVKKRVRRSVVDSMLQDFGVSDRYIKQLTDAQARNELVTQMVSMTDDEEEEETAEPLAH